MVTGKVILEYWYRSARGEIGYSDIPLTDAVSTAGAAVGTSDGLLVLSHALVLHRTSKRELKKEDGVRTTPEHREKNMSPGRRLWLGSQERLGCTGSLSLSHTHTGSLSLYLSFRKARSIGITIALAVTMKFHAAPAHSQIAGPSELALGDAKRCTAERLIPQEEWDT